MMDPHDFQGRLCPRGSKPNVVQPAIPSTYLHAGSSKGWPADHSVEDAFAPPPAAAPIFVLAWMTEDGSFVQTGDLAFATLSEAEQCAAKTLYHIGDDGSQIIVLELRSTHTLRNVVHSRAA